MNPEAYDRGVARARAGTAVAVESMRATVAKLEAQQAEDPASMFYERSPGPSGTSAGFSSKLVDLNLSRWGLENAAASE